MVPCLIHAEAQAQAQEQRQDSGTATGAEAEAEAEAQEWALIRVSCTLLYEVRTILAIPR